MHSNKPPQGVWIKGLADGNSVNCRKPKETSSGANLRFKYHSGEELTLKFHGLLQRQTTANPVAAEQQHPIAKGGERLIRSTKTTLGPIRMVVGSLEAPQVRVGNKTSYPGPS